MPTRQLANGEDMPLHPGGLMKHLIRKDGSACGAEAAEGTSSPLRSDCPACVYEAVRELRRETGKLMARHAELVAKRKE